MAAASSRAVVCEDLLQFDFASALPLGGGGLKAALLRPPMGTGEGSLSASGLSILLGSVCRCLSTGLFFIWVEKEHIAEVSRRSLLLLPLLFFRRGDMNPTLSH